MKSLLISSGGILRPKNGPILSTFIINSVGWLGPTPAHGIHNNPTRAEYKLQGRSMEIGLARYVQEVGG
jgi:hypothetical protein